MSADVLNTEEAARLIGVTPDTLKFWRYKGRGPRFIKLGKAKQAGVCYDLADIQAWKEERKFASTTAYSEGACQPVKCSIRR